MVLAAPPRRGLLAAAAVLAMDVAFSLIAAPLLKMLDPVMVAACSCALAAGMLTTYSAVAASHRWRPPTVPQAAVIAFLGVVGLQARPP